MFRHCTLTSSIFLCQVVSDPSSVEWKRVAAVEEFFDLISAYHCTEEGAHLGIKKTLARVSQCMQAKLSNSYQTHSTRTTLKSLSTWTACIYIEEY